MEIRNSDLCRGKRPGNTVTLMHWRISSFWDQLWPECSHQEGPLRRDVISAWNYFSLRPPRGQMKALKGIRIDLPKMCYFGIWIIFS